MLLSAHNLESSSSSVVFLTLLLVISLTSVCLQFLSVGLPNNIPPVFTGVLDDALTEGAYSFFLEMCEQVGLFLHISKNCTYLCRHLTGDSVGRSCVGVFNAQKGTWRGTSWLACSIMHYYLCSCWLVSWSSFFIHV